MACFGEFAGLAQQIHRLDAHAHHLCLQIRHSTIGVGKRLVRLACELHYDGDLHVGNPEGHQRGAHGTDRLTVGGMYVEETFHLIVVEFCRRNVLEKDHVTFCGVSHQIVVAVYWHFDSVDGGYHGSDFCFYFYFYFSSYFYCVTYENESVIQEKICSTVHTDEHPGPARPGEQGKCTQRLDAKMRVQGKALACSVDIQK